MCTCHLSLTYTSAHPTTSSSCWATLPSCTVGLPPGWEISHCYAWVDYYKGMEPSCRPVTSIWCFQLCCFWCVFLPSPRPSDCWMQSFTTISVWQHFGSITRPFLVANFANQGCCNSMCIERRCSDVQTPTSCTSMQFALVFNLVDTNHWIGNLMLQKVL